MQFLSKNVPKVAGIHVMKVFKRCSDDQETETKESIY